MSLTNDSITFSIRTRSTSLVTLNLLPLDKQTVQVAIDKYLLHLRRTSAPPDIAMYIQEDLEGIPCPNLGKVLWSRRKCRFHLLGTLFPRVLNIATDSVQRRLVHALLDTAHGWRQSLIMGKILTGRY